MTNLLDEDGIATKNAISRFADMTGRITRLDKEELKYMSK
jgi:hypothetical protein